MKIGEVAKRLDTTTRTLRFYEEQGLIEARRSPGGTRRYGEEEVLRFEAILGLAALGIPLSEIRRLAETRRLSQTGNQASRKVFALLEEMETELAARKAALEQTEADLRRAQALVARCFGCRRPPRRGECANCPVTEQLGNARVLQLIWDQAPDAAPTG